MKRLMTLALLLFAALILASAPAPLTAGYASCTAGRPAKPAKPAGCKDLRLVCACDSSWTNCQWQWICEGY